jgi:hypothetical protein
MRSHKWNAIYISIFAIIGVLISITTLYAQIPTDSPVAFYPFNGSTNDESGNGYNATYIDASLTTDRFGNDSSAYSFNGTSNIVQYGDILDSIFCAPIAKFSINGWAKTKKCGSFITGGGIIMSKSAGGSGPYQWNISHQDGRVCAAVTSDGIAQNLLWLSNPVPINQWFQFTLVFDGSLPEHQRLKLYINGDTSNTSIYKQSGNLGTTTLNSSQNICIGASHEYAHTQYLHSFYNGIIDDIRIYAKALTIIEIESLYHAGGWDTTNHGPIANAGPDQTVFIDSTSGASVTLNASLSSDADMDTLTYTWKESDTLLATGINPSVILPIGTHNISLTVNDGKGRSDTDMVVVSIRYLVNGLAAYYPFSGNADDSSGNGYGSTFVNATLTTDRFGKDFSAYSFNGTSNTIQYGDILDELFCAPVAKFTIIGWAKTRTFGSFTSAGNSIIGKSAGGTGPYQWNISHQEGLVTAFVSSYGTAQNYLWLSNPIPINKWFQFALVFDGSLPEMQRLMLFVNGQSSNTSVYRHLGILGTTTQYSTQNICVGASHENGYPQSLHSFYDGIIDDIRIYARALTKEEIDSLYNGKGWTNVEERNDFIPKSFKLFQNYPNPFNPSTTIIYELPVTSNILIKIYNIIGQEVMVLKNGFEQAGYHEVKFENSSLPSGIYFYQMKAGSFFETKKMILMK